MKNLLIYIHPSKGFDQTYSTNLAEVQIDSILDFWDKKDVLFAANFPYSYRGIETTVVPDDLFCRFVPYVSKVNTIIYLLEQGILNEPAWFHDLDAFQLHPFEVELEEDLGLATYEWKNQWNTGSMFFKPSALDIFKEIQRKAYAMRKNEEIALNTMTDSDENGVNSRIKKLNVTYNLGMRKLDYLMSLAEKPFKVAHFPPWQPGLMEMYKPILTDRLTELINEKFVPLP